MTYNMKTVFISGPFRGHNTWDTEQKIRRAEALSFEVWKLNEQGLRVTVICSHTNSRFFDETIDDKYFLEGYLALLLKSDVMLVTPDWESSEGARDEVRFCRKHGILVVYSIEELKDWLEDFRAVHDANPGL